MPSGQYTILGFSTQQENTASLTQLRCGTDIIATNYAVSLDQQLFIYECNGTININKTGNDKSFNLITYAPGYVSQATSTVWGYNPKTNIASSTDIQIYGSFSSGEVLITLFIFILIVIELVKMLFRALDRVYTKKRYIGYSNSDVEIKEEL